MIVTIWLIRVVTIIKLPLNSKSWLQWKSGLTNTSWIHVNVEWSTSGPFVFRIKDIPATAFQDLHSLEWIKLYNNVLSTLHYELMEPVLDTLMHIDIHSKFLSHSPETKVLQL